MVRPGIEKGMAEQTFTPPTDFDWLKTQPFAHRGLHGPGVVENSWKAFDLAIAQGHGIELDVQCTNDGDVVVFHDETLDRLTDEQGRVAQISSKKLQQIPIRGTGETISSLSETLHHIAGRVPVLIEIKGGAYGEDPAMLCLAVRRALEGYCGSVAIMSFSPMVVRWFRLMAPNITRGLVVGNIKTLPYKGVFAGVFEKFLKRIHFDSLSSVWMARPHFLAMDVRILPTRLSKTMRKRHIPVLTWTVNSAETWKVAKLHADNVIYEQFDA